MDQLIHRILKASWSLKIGVIAGLSALLTLANWYFVVLPTQETTTRAEAERKRLEGEFIDKQQIADNLNEYRREKAMLEEKLQAALAELPQERAIDELLRQLNELGAGSELQIVSVEPQPESKEQFFARIPVRMRVAGSYHEVASFLDEVGKLKRIVNVNEIKLGRPAAESEKIVLSAEFLATTFRFLTPEEQSQPQQSGKGKGKGGAR